MLHYSLRRAQRDMHTLYPLCAICACLLAKRHILQIFAFQLSSVNGLICFYSPVAYFFSRRKDFFLHVLEFNQFHKKLNPIYIVFVSHSCTLYAHSKQPIGQRNASIIHHTHSITVNYLVEYINENKKYIECYIHRQIFSII